MGYFFSSCISEQGEPGGSFASFAQKAPRTRRTRENGASTGEKTEDWEKGLKNSTFCGTLPFDSQWDRTGWTIEYCTLTPYKMVPSSTFPLAFSLPQANFFFNLLYNSGYRTERDRPKRRLRGEGEKILQVDFLELNKSEDWGFSKIPLHFSHYCGYSALLTWRCNVSMWCHPRDTGCRSGRLLSLFSFVFAERFFVSICEETASNSPKFHSLPDKQYYRGSTCRGKRGHVAWTLCLMLPDFSDSLFAM